MRHTGIFGGSFNPPHVGHLIVGESIRTQLGMDRIIFIPSAQPPHKVDVRLAPAELRLEMTKLAIDKNPFFAVSDIELQRGGTSYTVDTLTELHRLYPTDRFYLIIGADNWVEFETWRMPERILDLADIVVMTRPGFTIDRFSSKLAAPGPKVRFVDVPLIGISGTMIRIHRKSGRSIRYLVPPAVEEFIEKNALYRDKIG